MVLVDSSVWIDFFRGRVTPETARLKELLANENAAICGIVLAELMQGLPDTADGMRVRVLLEKLPYVPTVREDYLQAAELSRLARRRGKTVRGIIDCLIAAVALREHLELLCRDRDFSTLAGLAKLRLVAVRH